MNNNGRLIIITVTLGIVAIMYMAAFHNERNKNRELENKLQSCSKK